MLHLRKRGRLARRPLLFLLQFRSAFAAELHGLLVFFTARRAIIFVRPIAERTVSLKHPAVAFIYPGKLRRQFFDLLMLLTYRFKKLRKLRNVVRALTPDLINRLPGCRILLFYVAPERLDPRFQLGFFKRR